jgi:hypothetical protein
MSTPEPTPAASSTPAPAGTPTPVQTSAEAATAEPTAMPTEVARTVTETVAVSGGGFDPFAPSIPPGLLFFLGGLFVLAVGVAMTR